MIRNEVQRLTGLTRKAIEYYEEKELVVPRKHENGYREYTADDVSKLNKISLFRKLDLSLIEIKEILSGDSTGIHNILRRKQLETEFIQKKLLLLERVVNGTDIACISEEEIAYIEEQASLYDLEAMQKINASKIQAVENIEE